MAEKPDWVQKGMTLEERRAAGRKGALRSAAIRRAKRDDPMYGVRAALPSLVTDLIAAAQGRGVWKDLPLDKRLGALLKCIEYGLGKPIGVDKTLPRDLRAEGGEVEAPATLTFE